MLVFVLADDKGSLRRTETREGPAPLTCQGTSTNDEKTKIINHMRVYNIR